MCVRMLQLINRVSVIDMTIFPFNSALMSTASIAAERGGRRAMTKLPVRLQDLSSSPVQEARLWKRTAAPQVRPIFRTF